MALNPGLKLGAYQIIAPIGAGGMGEVYKARDTRLNRTVAIKVLLQGSADAERRARLEREAQTIAALNHPHICTLHDVGRHEGIDYLVMEYLEGETLERRLQRGPLPADLALKYAVEISDALDKAHRLGVTHRDLKPANIMLTQSGTKLLDFGLAKVNYGTQLSAVLSQMPTNPGKTAEGTILGTLQYMPPEQLEGKDTDARADIFAFGAVVYEMVTGKKAFEGTSQASLIAAILDREPTPILDLQPDAPPAIEHLIRRCLAKKPEDRWQTALDVHHEIAWIAQDLSRSRPKPSAAPASVTRPSRRSLFAVIAGSIVVTALITAAATTWIARSRGPSAQVGIARVSVSIVPGVKLDLALPEIALSPDGTQLVYAGVRDNVRELYLRSIDNPDATVIPGTEGGDQPFFSPDGQWVGFFATQGKLRKASIRGGAAQTLLNDVGNMRGATWAADGTIYFAPTGLSGIWKIPPGGKPEEVTKLDRQKGEVSHRFPQILPDGKHILFEVWTGPGSEERYVDVQSVDTGIRQRLVQSAQTPRYVSAGFLVFSRDQILMAAPFDLAHLTLTADPVQLIEHARQREGTQYAVSDTGRLAYITAAGRQEGRLVWVNRKGEAEPLPLPPRNYQGEAVLSDDGSKAAVGINGGSVGLWIYDFSRATLAPLVTPDGSTQAAVWTPDGKRIVYRGTRKGFRNLFWKPVDGLGNEERLTTSENFQTPGSWSPDGRWLAFWEVDPVTRSDIWVIDMSGDRKPVPFINTSASEANPHFSPDGRWIAYTSDESGKSEVYVSRFPGPPSKIPISNNGGTEPAWSRNKRELLYRNGTKMMAVDVQLSPAFSAGAPHMLFDSPYAFTVNGISAFDTSLDGQRLLMIQPGETGVAPTQIDLVLNWFEELRQGAAKR
jgi:serine/threonine protein kinase/Tol biopolymer transport system component